MKCVQYGVACNYNTPTGFDLQVAKEQRLDSSSGQISFGSTPLESCIQSFAVVGIGPDSFTLNVDDLSRLSRFQNRTAYTFATVQSTELYKNDVVRLAMEVSRLLLILRKVFSY